MIGKKVCTININKAYISFRLLKEGGGSVLSKISVRFKLRALIQTNRCLYENRPRFDGTTPSSRPTAVLSKARKAYLIDRS